MHYLPWFLILIPLSVDQYLSIPIGNYDLRLPYLGLLISFLMMSYEYFKRVPSTIQLIKERLQSKSFLFWCLMGFVGLLGALQSIHPKRAWPFLIWTVGTLSFVPLCAKWLNQKLPQKTLATSLTLYIFVQSLLIVVDLFLCNFTTQGIHLGRVYQWHFCRPHAWYQEPGYFATFGILAWIWLRAQPQKHFTLITLITLSLALIACTSRLGWIMLGILLSLETAQVLKQKKIKPLLTGVIGGTLVLAVLVFSLKPLRETFNSFLSTQVSPISYDRLINAQGSFWVFKNNPWVGAGPGSAGAYFVDFGKSHPYYLYRMDEKSDPEQMRNDPLSFSIYLEVLSEWGVLGALFFFLGLFFFLKNLSISLKLYLMTTLPLIYLTAQTLPRFDLWWMLSLLVLTPAKKEIQS